jgi:DNA (cytosine-5)-methyltransferase 1
VSGLVLSLFPGIGLLDMAFETEGFCVVRGPDLLWGGDIRTFHPPAGRFEGVIGGPPCQSFSPLANLVRARGYEPKFGNLIPEYERCVTEAMPGWFLMEEVPQAPAPAVPGYAVHAFTMCNSSLDAGDGYGLEQERLRRFSFGVLGARARDLREHIQLAALRLPRASPTVTQSHINNTEEAKGRIRENTLVWNPAPGQRSRTQAVLADRRAVPVAIGGSGKRKATVTNRRGKDSRGHGERYSIDEAVRLQGLPPRFLEHAPFTMGGKLKTVANGVPIPMGRAIARAVKAAFAQAVATA